MNKVLKSMAIGFSLVAGLQAMDAPMDENPKKRTAIDAILDLSEGDQKRLRLGTPLELNLFGNSPNDITLEILRQTSMYQILELGSGVSFDSSIGNLRLVCKNWQTVIDTDIDPNKTDNLWIQKKKDYFINSIILIYKTIGHGEDCEQFLKSELIYAPDIGESMYFPIANLKNPLSGEFDLSKCGIAGQHLSINTGHRKGKITENSDKIEIWLTPWFVAKNNLNSTARHLESIFIENWDGLAAPVGIFWNWGGYDTMDLCDYSTCPVGIFWNWGGYDTMDLYDYSACMDKSLLYVPLYQLNCYDMGIDPAKDSISYAKNFTLHFKQKLD